MMTLDDAAPLDSLSDLMPVFIPAQAAEILRRLGLSGMTECALRTRAYRRQVPFHRNGNRITFTLADLKEIAEGVAHRPEPRKQAEPQPSPVPARRRPRSQQSPTEDTAQGAWRARRSL
jgi:hypothetical protein